MKKNAIRLIACVVLLSLSFNLLSCEHLGKWFSKDQGENGDAVHTCSFIHPKFSSYPTFGIDGAVTWYCDCGKNYEESTSWKESVLFDVENYVTTTFKMRTEEEKDIYKKNIKGYNEHTFYASLEEMFLFDVTRGDLESVTDGKNTIYINKYTGTVYYRDNVTGELTASTGVNGLGEVVGHASGIPSITLFDCDNHCEYLAFNFLDEVRDRLIISKTENSIRAKVFVGTYEAHALIPYAIEAHEFENDILRPLLDYLYHKMCENLGEEFAIDYFNGQRKIGNRANGTVTVSDEYYYNEEDVYADRFLHDTSLRVFFDDVEKIVDTYKRYITINQFDTIDNDIRIKEIKKIITEIEVLFNSYYSYNPSHPKFKPNENTPQKVLEGYSMYTVKNPTYDQLKYGADVIKKYVPNYTFEMILEHEAFCGYEAEHTPSTAIVFELEYILNGDGSFSINLVKDSLLYDDVHYTLAIHSDMYLINNENVEVELGERVFLSDKCD